MIDFLGVWWVWMALALLLGLAEVLLPGFIFLGFALGAVLMAAVVLLFPGVGIPWLVAIFAVLSLLAWVGLRVAFKRQSSGARIVTRDINDN
jgi:membrane protein implicated in regulation of membrane protease activity